MNVEEIKTIVELLKQSYMEEKWELVLEAVEILQREEEVEEYTEDEDENYNEVDF